MDDAQFVGRLEGFGDLPRDVQRLGERKRSAGDPLGQRLAVDQFEHERAEAIGLFEPKDRADVRVVERRQYAGFTFEPFEALRVTSELWVDDLDRHIAAEPGVTCAVHLSHATHADALMHLVCAEPSPAQVRGCHRGMG